MWVNVLHPLTFTSWPGLILTPLTWGSEKAKAGLGSLVTPVEAVGKRGQWVTCRLLGEEALKTLCDGCEERKGFQASHLQKQGVRVFTCVHMHLYVHTCMVRQQKRVSPGSGLDLTV